MRALFPVAFCALVSACSVIEIPIEQSEIPSPSDLERTARNGCKSSPNTDDWLNCRRRTQDSWRNPREGPKPVYAPGGVG